MAHIHEKIDYAVDVFVVYQNKVLLRKHDKYGIWLSVGGHIELDEDPNEAALREVKEEVGLDVKLLDTREFFGERGVQELIAPVSLNRHPITDTHEHISLIYFAKATSDNVVPENEEDEWKWCTQAELESFDELRAQVRFYALKALEKVTD